MGDANVTDEARVDVQPKYPGNVLTAFENGCNLDLRVKLAVEFIKGGAIGAMEGDGLAERAAILALDLATALLDEGAKRGLVTPMPDHGEINAPTRHHIERNARAQVYAQHAGARAAREESGQVQPVGASVMSRGMS